MAQAATTGETRKSFAGGVFAACIGLALAGLGAFMALSFITGDVGVDPRESAKTCWTGLLGAWMAYGGLFTLGRVPALLMAVLVFLWGLYVARTMRLATTWPQVFGGALIVASTSLGVCAFADSYDMNTGGLLAVYASPPALLYFGRWGLIVAAVGVMILGILLAFGEAAVNTAHRGLFLLRDMGLGLFSMGARLLDLFRLLASPRLSVAGVGAGMDMNEAVSGSPAPSVSSVPSAPVAEREKREEPTAPATARTAVKEWKPREGFQSRFLDIEPASPIDPADMAVASASASDVIVDMDAVMEESDVVASPFITPSAPVAPVTPAAPVLSVAPRIDAPKAARKVDAPVRPGAYGDQSKQAQTPPVKSDMAEYKLPSLEILDPPEPPVMEDAGLIEAKAKILEQTLAEFKIEGRVVHIERGPRVTMYELNLAPGIRLNKVTSLADNIAMQLQAESVRIIAPIPGKNTIGIEIPNTCKELVSLREIVGAVNREKRRQALPVCLGKDVSGQALVADLARMPHLLIAGATGSGKSVCINSIIMSVMMCCRPDETQLIMVDPKVVELSRFKDIPHLMSPVITDMKRAVSVLDWICQKMDERYEQMSQVSVNNIAKFNALGEEGIRDRLDEFASLEDIEAFPKKMPYMVVIIDELADLMMVAGKEVEQHITRLAAKSRAVGIHLILATQRPSVDVITGLIKANMPCRIAFQVASRVDSRTILDGNGAETLLGQGDMLYLPPGVGKLTRAQGVFVSDEELFRVVDFVKSEAAPQYHEDLLGPVIGGGSGAVDVSKFDELFMQSGEAIIENQRGSVSLLQRKFGIGYGRASRIIDQLASVGLLGPFRDGKAREILLTVEEFRSKFGGASSGSDRDDDEDGDGDGEYGMAGLRDDERERVQPDWEDENEAV
ncbi:MAG: DNA translocase FtsK [Planctomycetota bacterium]|jgi:S-DNA-T family DNA segregation ATPase FtsK/SpoIIIE|nr:DNA translocase FtsK [Planctomycetota bacterium]